MPGILVMNQHGADGAPGRDAAAPAVGDALALDGADKAVMNGGVVQPPSQSDAAISTTNTTTTTTTTTTSSSTSTSASTSSAIAADSRNGDVLPNGVVLHDRGQSGSGGADDQGRFTLDLPPEIRMQIQDELFSFPKMVQRAAQQCYSGLAKLLADMAELPDASDPSGPLTNGANGRFAVNSAAARKEESLLSNKKVRMLRFTDAQQTVFAKLLIMAQWTPHMPEVRRLLDVDKWLHMRETDYNFCRAAMLDLSRQGRYFREPNPDIGTALEILSTGKAPWIPDLPFIQPEPLTPQEILKQLRNMNTTLSIRLNLHEDLPRHLRNWSVKNGWATFTIPGEFELDVSTTDDNPSSPFFFIDLRFLFQPEVDIPDGRFRDELLEPQLNTILQESGLSGCYDYLHNFCLTQKILSLRRQAIQMIQGHWAGAVRVDLIHRVLVIQYWTGMPGSKSWIEIGVSSGRSKRVSWRGPEPAFLSVRWMRNAQEVRDRSIDFDWKSLDMERSLEKVLALHIQHLFRSIHGHLQDVGSLDSTLATRLHLSDDDPSGCRLEVTLGRPSNRVQVQIDHLTGRFVLRPPGPAATAHENEINNLRNPAHETHRLLARFLCVNLKSQIEREIDQYGWEPVRNLPIRSEEVKQALGTEVLTSSFFRGRGWTADWLLAVTFNLTGDSWWIVEFKDEVSSGSISSVRRIPTERFWSKTEPVSQLFLQRLEQHAITDIAAFATQRELGKQRISHHRTIDSTARKPVDVVCVKTADLLKAALPGLALTPAWATPIMRLYFNKFTFKDGRIVHVIIGKTSQPDEANLGVIKASPKDGVHFGRDGSFTLLLRTPFGEPCLSDLLFRLRSITRLRRFAAVLKAVKMPRPPRYNLSQLEFIYATAPASLTATVCFPEHAPLSIHFAPANPHQRIRTRLNALLAGDPTTGFRAVVEHLLLTLPLLRALDAIEQPTQPQAPATAAKSDANADPENASNPPQPPSSSSSSSSPSSSPPSNPLFPPPMVHARDLTWYRVVYAPPNPACSFDVRLRWRRDELAWHVNDTKALKPDDRPAHERAAPRDRELDEKLAELYRERGEGWSGIRTGLVGSVVGVEEAMRRLDEVVRRCRREEALKGGAEEVVVAAGSEEAAVGEGATKSAAGAAGGTQNQGPLQQQGQPQSQPQQAQALAKGMRQTQQQIQAQQRARQMQQGRMPGGRPQQQTQQQQQQQQKRPSVVVLD